MSFSKRCPRRVRPTFEFSPEIAAQVAATARVAPLYEAGLYTYVIRRHYSLQRNAHLLCGWENYKKDVRNRKTEPFQFPNERDLHFYNGMIRFLPSETEYKRPSFRKSLKPGPGVDYAGQMTIPQELMMKRTSSTKKKTRKQHNDKAETNNTQEAKKIEK